MPFLRAKRSHFVSDFSAGRGFSLGNGVVAVGKLIRVPSVELWVIVHVVRSWLIKACAQSRETAAISAFVGCGGIGLLSLQIRLPRSKVYGIGFSTTTGLLQNTHSALVRLAH